LQTLFSLETNLKNAVIDSFAINTVNNNLILVLLLTIDNGLNPIQLEVKWNSSKSRRDDFSQRLLGLLKVAAVKSTEQLPEAEVRVAFNGKTITAIGHKSEERWWQLAPSHFSLVA